MRLVLPQAVRRLLLLAAMVAMASSLILALMVPGRELIRVSAVYGSVDVAILTESSDVIAVVRYTGESRVAWNSADNERWEPPVGSGVSAWIYRDDTFEVVRTLQGNFDTTRIVIRGVGGTVGNVTMKHDSQVDWKSGGTYLLFLRRELTPTKEGSEQAWTVTWNAHGAFAGGPSGWTNASRTLDVYEEQLVDAE